MRLNPKVVVFYVAMVAFLIVSFGVISEYGTRTLAAPSAVSGIYTLSSDGKGTPDCFGATVAPLLVIGQSGSFLNADFVSGDGSEEQLTRAFKGNGALTGQIQAGLVRLEGTASTPASCMNKQPLTLEATVSNDTLHGHLIWQGKRFSLIGHKK